MTNAECQSRTSHLFDLSKIAKGASMTFSGSIGGKGILFLYTIFLAKVLSPSDLGLYFLGIVIIGFLTVLSHLGTDVGVVRFIAIYNGRNDASRTKGAVLIAALFTVLTSLILVGAIFLLGDFVASHVFHKPEFGRVIKLLSLTIPFSSLMRIFLASTRGFKIMKYSVYTENLAWVGMRFFFAVFFLYGLGMGLEGVILAYVTSSIFSAALAFHYANKLIPLIDRKRSAIFEAKSLLKFSVPMVFSTFIYNLMRQIDILMLGLFVSAAQVGIYSVAVRIIILAEVLFMAFQPVFNPFIAELCEKKQFMKLSNLLKALTRWGFTISFPVFLSLLLFPAFFLDIFGNKFVQASGCVSILVIAHIFSSVSSLPNSIIFMSGRSGITLKNNVGLLIVNCCLNYLFIPKYGILGAAFATGTCLVLIAFIRIAEVYYLMKIQPFRIDLLKPLLAGLIPLGIILLLRRSFSVDGNAFIISALLFTFFLIYCLLIFCFKLTEEDHYMKEIVRQKLMALIKKRGFLDD